MTSPTSPRSTSDRCFILVLGMHRSGTSAMARVLNLLGVDLGSDLLPPQQDNPQGFWEHREVLRLHEGILATLGSTWHDVFPLPTDWPRAEALQSARQRLAGLIAREFDGDVPCGVKDPRLCRLVPLWVEVLASLGISPRFVIMVRNPLEVVTSLERRNGFGTTKSTLLYLDHMLRAILNTAGYPRVLVAYDRLLTDWRREVARISDTFSCEWPRRRELAAHEIDEFLDPSAQHHFARSADVSRRPWTQDWATGVYRVLERAVVGHVEDLDETAALALEQLESAQRLFLPELDRLAGELASGNPLLGSQPFEGALQLRMQLSAEQDAAERTALDLEQERRQTASLAHELASARAAIEDLESDGQRLESDIASLREELARQKSHTSTLEADLGDLKRQLASARSNTSRAHAAAAALEQERTRLLRNLERSRIDVQRLLRESDQLRRAKKHLRQLNTGLGREITRNREELSKVQAHLTRILSSRLLRYTRPARQLWYRLKGEA